MLDTQLKMFNGTTPFLIHILLDTRSGRMSHLPAVSKSVSDIFFYSICHRGNNGKLFENTNEKSAEVGQAGDISRMLDEALPGGSDFNNIDGSVIDGELVRSVDVANCRTKTVAVMPSFPFARVLGN